MKHFIQIVIILFAVSTSKTFPQDSLLSSSNTWGWLAVTFGPATGKDFSGLAAGITLNYVNHSQIYSVRLLYAEKAATAEPLSQFSPTSKNLHSVSDAGALYGFAMKDRFFLLSVSGGIGYVWGRNVERNTFVYFRSVALPVELQLGFSPVKAIGMCLYVFANFNFNSSFYGTMLCIQLGKV
jgi:hypothetical protein